MERRALGGVDGRMGGGTVRGCRIRTWSVVML